MTAEQIQEVKAETKVVDNRTGEDLVFIIFNVLLGTAMCATIPGGIVVWVEPEYLSLGEKT